MGTFSYSTGTNVCARCGNKGGLLCSNGLCARCDDALYGKKK